MVRGSCDFGISNLGLSHVKHDFRPLSNLSAYMPLGEVLEPEVILYLPYGPESSLFLWWPHTWLVQPATTGGSMDGRWHSCYNQSTCNRGMWTHGLWGRCLKPLCYFSGSLFASLSLSTNITLSSAFHTAQWLLKKCRERLRLWC